MISITIAMVAGFLVGAVSVGVLMALLLMVARSKEHAQAYTAGRSVGQYEQELHRQNEKLAKANEKRKELEAELIRLKEVEAELARLQEPKTEISSLKGE